MKKLRVHICSCCFCGKSIYVKDVAIITFSIKNTDRKSRSIMPMIERQTGAHRHCIKDRLTEGILQLMPKQIREVNADDTEVI